MNRKARPKAGPKGKQGTRLGVRLEQLAAKGIVTLPTRKRLAEIRRVKVRGGPVSATIVEDRR